MMSQEIEEAVQRNKEHQQRLDELQKLNQDYENKLDEQRKLSNELFTSLQSEWRKVEELEQKQRDAVISKQLTDKEILREKI